MSKNENYEKTGRLVRMGVANMKYKKISLKSPPTPYGINPVHAPDC